MNTPFDQSPNLAVFCDFENVAIGVRDARYAKFDINLVLERLLDKGKIIVKKAYADWSRYKAAKRPLHEAAFELIEIPHVSYSGKNSADIRLVVDALDLCYTKPHLDVFVIVSGDSDFSPLVSKLRENDKTVIGLGIKNSSADLLIENCDEFIYYDDLVRDRRGMPKRAGRDSGSDAAEETGPERSNAEARPRGERGDRPAGERGSDRSGGAERAGADRNGTERASADRAGAERPPANRKSAERTNGGAPPAEAEAPSDPESEADANAVEEPPPIKGTLEERRQQALDMVLDTVDALFRDRDDNLWGSMVKQTLKRKRPTFSETFHGYRNFTELLLDAGSRGLLEIQKDEKSGGYVIIGFGPNA